MSEQEVKGTLLDLFRENKEILQALFDNMTDQEMTEYSKKFPSDATASLLADPYFWRNRFKNEFLDIYFIFENLDLGMGWKLLLEDASRIAYTTPGDFSYKLIKNYLDDGRLYLTRIQAMNAIFDTKVISADDYYILSAGIPSIFDYKCVLPPDTWKKYIGSYIAATNDLKNVKAEIIIKLIETALGINDVEHLKSIFEAAKITPDTLWSREQIRSAEALRIYIDVFKPPESIILVIAAQLGLLEYFDKFQRGSIPKDLGEDLLLGAAQSGNLELLKHLIDVVETDFLEGFLWYSPADIATSYGKSEIAKYLLSQFADDETYLNDMLKTAISTDKFPDIWCLGANKKIEIINERIEILKLLSQYPQIVFSDKELQHNTYPNLRLYSQDNIKILQSLATEIAKFFFQDPRFKIPSQFISFAISEGYKELSELLLLDYRTNLDNLGKFDKAIRSKYSDILATMKEKKKELPQTLLTVHTLPKLSYKEKYKLLQDLDKVGKLDSLTSELVKNDKFKKAYLVSNEELARMLNDANIPYVPHLNHAAAAALYADDIESFRLSTPESSYAVYQRNR